MENRYVAVVVGGAVSGSEAVFQLRENGIVVICIEQNSLPYGKIEDGLPRWHVEQRKKEEEKIDERITHPLVHFVPHTKLGKDLSFEEIYKDWQVSAILLANGAWRDRPLGIEGIDQFIEKGLVYQNPLVYWFNHYHEPGYRGTHYNIPDNTIVIGGGLASMDVLKICQIELTQKTLKARGIQVDMLKIEKEGIPKTLAAHGLSWLDLGLKGTSLFYRRRIEDMPLAEAPLNANPEEKTKAGALRRKILNNFQTKFLFNFFEQHLPQKAILEKDRLVGLQFVKTQIANSQVKVIPDSETDVRSNLVISSIGSIPEPLPGLPQKGEYYDVQNQDTGEVKGFPFVFALGNAVTGKGNIRVSLLHGRQVAKHAIEQLKANPSRMCSSSKVEQILSKVQKLQQKVGFEGDYKTWRDKQLAQR